MKRFAISEWENEDGQMEQGGLEEDAVFGDYVRYEDVEPIVADRDIKAANLQLLAKNLLTYSAFVAQFEDGPPYDNAGKDADNMWDQLLDLARSIKQ